jgi:hypothetical protein
MKLIVAAILFPLAFMSSPTSADTEVERMSLIQRPEIQVQHQRLVGNVRAQARREGVVVNTPQLYVYLSDHTATYHMDGIRRGFERELNLLVQRSRTARSMVRLDRLLERVKTADGESIAPGDLPPADVYLMLYRRANCPVCDEVEATLENWLASEPDLRVVWMDVLLGER